MDQDLWAEAVTTILTTLESAFLGENASPINNTTASSSRYKADSKKHARRATSDTMSDIELSGSPVKRRRESIDGTYSDNGEIAKHTAKSRKLSSALSRQFARSLSVSNGSAVEPVAQPDGDAMVEDDAIDNSRVSPYALSVSSSSSSLSSISPWPSTRASSDFMTSDTAAEYGGNLADNTPTDRVFVFPSAARSQKAREKASTNSNTHLIPFPQQPSSRCSMDMDSSDGNSIFSQSRFPVADGGGSNSNSNSNSGGGGVVHSVANYDVFSKLLAQTPIRGDLTEESVHAEVHRWAMEQSIKTEEPPNVLIASLESKISRLRELIPQISKQMASTHKSTSLSGDNLHEFYQAGCEVAAIGEWLKVRQFPLLSVFFSSLAQILPQLQRYIQASLIIGDMYRLLSWSPEFSLSLSDISNEYEELVNSKRLLYGDTIAEDGLKWKAMGLPFDPMLFARVRQWMASASEACLTHIARISERRAKSSSTFGKDELSTDTLIHCSLQVLHSAAACAAMCGAGFPSLAPQTLYIAAECTTWSCNRFRTLADSSHSDQPRVGKKQLTTRAMRLIQAGEGITKMLHYSKFILASPNQTLSDVHLRPEHTETTLGAQKNLAVALVEMSWLLAETLTAFRADSQLENPSGVLLLYIEFILKFAKRVVDFGGSGADKKKLNTGELQQISRIQSYIQLIKPSF